MKKYLQIIALLLPILSYCQLDSTYQIFNRESSFQKIYFHNNKLSIVGKYAESYQQDYPFITVIDDKINRTYNKKLDLGKYFDYYRFSQNTIDGTYLLLAYNNNSSGERLRTVAKFNHNGEKLFTIELSVDSLGYTQNIIQTSDSGYLLTGYNFYSNFRYYTIAFKLSSIGKVQWYKRYEPNALNSMLGMSSVEKNGSYYQLLINEKKILDSPFFHYETWINKLDKNGTLIKTWNATDSNTIPNIDNFEVDNEENIIYTGIRYQKLMFDTVNNIVSSKYINRPYIFCRDKNNLVKWELALHKDQTVWSGANTLKKLKNGNYVAVGDNFNENWNDSTYTGFAINFDSTGKINWQKNYRKSLKLAANKDDLIDFIELQDNSLILIGSSYQYYNKNGDINDYGKREYGWAIRTDKNGEILKSTSSISRFEDEAYLAVFPNPFVNQFKIRIRESTLPLFQIYDLRGRAINLTHIQTSFTKDELTINLSTLVPNGMYFLCIQTEGAEKIYKIEKRDY